MRINHPPVGDVLKNKEIFSTLACLYIFASVAKAALQIMTAPAPSPRFQISLKLLPTLAELFIGGLIIFCTF